MANKSLNLDRLQLGACYYPEHWKESLWADDFRRMRELGLSIIRVGEFAWSIFEPVAGTYSFSLFDQALDLAHEHGLRVILGTPTATPPAWLTHAHPEVLNVSRAGVRYQHGQRRHYNYNAPIYRDLAARIVTAMAEHYKDHPAIVGWQIDNEINCEVNVFYSDADHAAFRTWLRCRYGDLEHLNLAWGTVFWSQTYTDWGQVHLTRPTVSDSPNPHQALDEKRFFSDSAISFVTLQAEIIRRIAPRHWITTNGLFGHLDSHRMTEEGLDFLSYDSYPNLATIWPDEGPEPLLDRKWSWNLSVVRDVSPQFCVMEQQSGPNGWVNRLATPAPRPGQMRLWTYQSVAHGADAVLYFRWRTATMGTEIYWHGLNDQDNQPNRRVTELGRIGAEFAAIGNVVAGSEFQAEVAILKDYDNLWDGELDIWHGPLEQRSTTAWNKALQYRHVPINVLFLRETTTGDDLRHYKVLIYPHPAIADQHVAALLSDYVHQGGTLILGCRSGYKDRRGHCPMQPLPGPFADLSGVRVEDFTLIGPHQEAPQLIWAEGIDAVSTTADGFNDILVPSSPDTSVLARYHGAYYAGAPAITRRSFGTGWVYYHGAAFNEVVVNTLIDLCGIRSPADGLMTLAEEIELCIRARPETGTSLWFLLNYSGRTQLVVLLSPHVDILIGAAVGGVVTVEPYGVVILEM